MKKLNILITAGATREPIDPVRFISNRATGTLGLDIARAAKNRKHNVVVIGASGVKAPAGIQTINVETARELEQAINKKLAWCNCLVMSAAVSDFRVRNIAARKIKRGNAEEFILRLKPNPDIIRKIAEKLGKKRCKLLVGFALETEHLKKHAQEKIAEKNLDLIVATQMKSTSYPFGNTKINVLMINKQGVCRAIQAVSKPKLAMILLDSIEKIMLS